MKRLYMFDLDGTLIEEFIRTEQCAKCRGTGDFFDTACDECNGKGRIFGEVLDYDRVELLPGRREKLQDLRKAGANIAICTNQGGISLGYQSFRQVMTKLERTIRALGFREPAYTPRTGAPQLLTLGQGPNVYCVFSPYHPEGSRPIGDPDDRKPMPGMLDKALMMYGVEPEDALMVGDLATDEGAAYRAGVEFRWAEDFFR